MSKVIGVMSVIAILLFSVGSAGADGAAVIDRFDATQFDRQVSGPRTTRLAHVGPEAQLHRDSLSG